MTLAFVELSGEAPTLAGAEAVAAAEALGGRAVRSEAPIESLVAVELPDEPTAAELARRLALARRCLVLRARGRDIGAALEELGARYRSASVRRLGRPSSGGKDTAVLDAGAAFKHGGGSIDLDRPAHRFWLGTAAQETPVLFEEVAAVDRRSAAGRRMPSLPFQRPVSLPPRLARAAANLARIRSPDRVVDPFLGTGALLAEAGLLGGRLFGIDREPEMVRGALRNLAHLGLAADELVVGDAGAVEFWEPEARFEALLTDPPYGRASTTGGEDAAALVARVLPRWAERVRPGGRLVVIVPGPIDPPGEEWTSVLDVTVRVHRSLSRVFRVFERFAVTSSPPPSS
jgi:putative methyltransferase (TIGR01177 family)